MLRFRRPPRARDFETTVRDARAAVKAAIEATGPPSFPELWKKYKANFSRAQSGKCGYCEVHVLASYWGDVEHFAPKGAVWELKADPATWGKETADLAQVTGRERDEVSNVGYWWLAYNWKNYLLSCMICNTAWKGSFFHVSNTPRSLPPHENIVEGATLLNPFEKVDYDNHLRFDILGQVQGISDRGIDTVRTVGLDREQLRRSRSEKARQCHSLALRLVNSSEETKSESYRDFLELGRKEHVHAGMVRILFAQLTLTTWNDLEKILGVHNT